MLRSGKVGGEVRGKGQGGGGQGKGRGERSGCCEDERLGF